MSIRTNEQSALRVVRGALLAVSSAALAVSAHAIADGGVPDAALTLLLTTLIGWTATALATKSRGALGTVAVLGAGQVVMHTVLTTLVTHAELHSGGSGLLPSGPMFATHALATLATALLLAHADTLLLTAVAALRLLLPVVWRPVPVPAAPARALAFPPVAGHLTRVTLRRLHARRGPPVYS
ncbi:hypothetical protein SAMN05421504_1021141 [Amycolatopsis xylanica]|uniref:Uncharacterized protein n=1 Tax=Amycolatopsis xylanica TaxID=589385 RepID=A0A1H3B200_9PSEU|nr:hypothetical protein [Amycolatopsis xylanica]SDX35681.1 hypothetical protein SAMN05421504_1021141 [Amycolatopsis xylanica]